MNVYRIEITVTAENDDVASVIRAIEHGEGVVTKAPVLVKRDAAVCSCGAAVPYNEKEFYQDGVICKKCRGS
jgi:hypothetical protein